MSYFRTAPSRLIYGAAALLAAAAIPAAAAAQPRVVDGYIEIMQEDANTETVAPAARIQVIDAKTRSVLQPLSREESLNNPEKDKPDLSAVRTGKQNDSATAGISNTGELREPKNKNTKTLPQQTQKLNASNDAELAASTTSKKASNTVNNATSKPQTKTPDKKAKNRQANNESTSVSVEIAGLSDDLEKNARSFLTLARKDAVVRTRYQLRRQAKRGIAEIQNAIKVYGYYNSEVKAEVDAKSKPWTVIYTVKPGPQVKVAGIEITATGPGSQLTDIQAAIADPKIAIGDALNHQAYEREKAILRRAAYNAGYLNAKYGKRELRVNPKTNEAVVELALETGPLFQFGEVIFEQSVIKPKLMRAFVPFKEGDTFSTDKLVALQLALNDTRYFSRVDVDVDRDAAKPVDGSNANNDPDILRIPVQVKTFPGKPKSYKFGIGWGTDTGTRSTIGYENRRLNRSGHQFNTELRISEQTTTAAARYSLPVLNPGTDKLSFDARYVNDNPATGKSIQQTIGARLERNGVRWRRSAYIDYTREAFQLGDESRKSQLLIPGATVTWVNTTDRLRPNWGLRLSGDLHGSVEGPLTDTTFAQGRLETDIIRSLSKRWRLLQRNRLVYSWLADEFDSLPASQRLFAGGTGSVRGYSFQDLSPRDEDGTRIGGRHLYTASIEAEYQWAKSWATSIFVDAGNASQNFLEDPKYGVGIGMRWILPFGQARLDIAMPIGDEDEDSPRVHISIGPDL